MRYVFTMDSANMLCMPLYSSVQGSYKFSSSPPEQYTYSVCSAPYILPSLVQEIVGQPSYDAFRAMLANPNGEWSIYHSFIMKM